METMREKRQKKRCNDCDWKFLEHHGNHCYMFSKMMLECMKFKPSATK